MLKSKLPVNWENGMMINANHLVAMNDFIISATHNAAAVRFNPINYGLLPSNDKRQLSLEFNSETPREYFRIELTRCIAVMPNSIIVNIQPETVNTGVYNRNNLVVNVDLNESREQYLLIYLEVNHTWETVGTPAENEQFDRKPFLNITPKLRYTTLKNPEEISDKYGNSQNVLPLALYDTQDRTHPSLVKFIPPCMSLDAHPPLLHLFEELHKISEELLGNCREVMCLVHEDSQRKFHAQVAVDMGAVLPPILNALIDINSQFRTALKHAPPVQLVQLFKRLAIAIRTGLFTLSQGRLREMENYFAEFYGIPVDFMKTASILESAEYSHVNIYHSSFKKVINLLKVYSNLFDEMVKKGLKTPEAVSQQGYQEYSGGSVESTPKSVKNKKPEPKQEPPSAGSPDWPNLI